MTQNEMLTYGTVAFAVFTLFYVFKKTPTATAVATQPGQQQRDAHLADFLTQWGGQGQDLTLQANMSHYNPFTQQLGF